VRRAYFWAVSDLDKLLEDPKAPTRQELEMMELNKIYRQLPQENWARRGAALRHN
jgi:hypothetical protein